MTFTTSAARTRRLVQLHHLRASVEAEIVRLEAEVSNEIELIRQAKSQGVNPGRKIPECGTDSGYYRHRRKTNTAPCDACRLAHNLAERQRSQRAKSGANEQQMSDVA